MGGQGSQRRGQWEVVGVESSEVAEPTSPLVLLLLTPNSKVRRDGVNLGCHVTVM